MYCIFEKLSSLSASAPLGCSVSDAVRRVWAGVVALRSARMDYVLLREEDVKGVSSAVLNFGDNAEVSAASLSLAI